MSNEWEVVIGLEIHVQLATSSKIFSGASTEYGAEPNTQASLVDLGYPGVLPVLNSEAVKMAIMFGLAINADIASHSIFARKNYFYPDLPKGYQISQYELPIVHDGELFIRGDNGKNKRIGITRAHLEEDAGKSIHAENGDGTKVDFNRCGVPLVEIVSEPVIQSSEEAKAYLVRLKQILEYLNICDCNMEKGNLRCDANISVRPLGESKFGVKTEMKNMNSFRGVERGLTSEIVRQAQVLDEGGEVEQVTLLWNEAEQKAEVMRSKEEAHDYRYFPDPDLVPLSVSDNNLDSIRSSLVEMPYEREERFVNQYGLRLKDVLVLTSEKLLADYFEETVSAGAEPAEATKWIMGEMLSIIKDGGMSVSSFPVTPDQFAGLLNSVKNDTVNVATGKDILRRMVKSDLTAAEIIKKEGLAQVSDESALSEAVAHVVANNPDELGRYREGKKALFGFFMGEVMKVTGGKSDPKVVKKLLTSSLESD